MTTGLLEDRVVAGMAAWLAGDPALSELFPAGQESGGEVQSTMLVVLLEGSEALEPGLEMEPIRRLDLSLELRFDSAEGLPEDAQALAQALADRVGGGEEEALSDFLAGTEHDVALSAHWTGEAGFAVEGDQWLHRLAWGCVAG